MPSSRVWVELARQSPGLARAAVWPRVRALVSRTLLAWAAAAPAPGGGAAPGTFQLLALDIGLDRGGTPALLAVRDGTWPAGVPDDAGTGGEEAAACAAALLDALRLLGVPGAERGAARHGAPARMGSRERRVHVSASPLRFRCPRLRAGRAAGEASACA